MPHHPARLIGEEAAWCGFARGRYQGRGEGRNEARAGEERVQGTRRGWTWQ